MLFLVLPDVQHFRQDQLHIKNASSNTTNFSSIAYEWLSTIYIDEKKTVIDNNNIVRHCYSHNIY